MRRQHTEYYITHNGEDMPVSQDPIDSSAKVVVSEDGTHAWVGYLAQDDDCDNPRRDPYDYDNGSVMACFHRRYNLGDKDLPFSDSEFGGWAEMEKHIRKSLDAAVVLPLYLYDHSGITISTSPFSCPWDSGQVGFIYITKEGAREQYGVKRITQQILSRIEEGLKAEVKGYDSYLTGDVYGVCFDRVVKNAETGEWEHDYEQDIVGYNGDGTPIGGDTGEDACWGYIGREYAEKEVTEGLERKAKKFAAKVS